MKCLIVEDDFTARNLLQEYLRDLGSCDVAVNGREAVESFKHALDQDKPYDLMCLDLMMPEMTGMGALKAIRRIEKECGVEGLNGVKVIVTTALSDSAQIKDAFKTGCEAYLVKPIRKESLLGEMEKLGLIPMQVKE